MYPKEKCGHGFYYIREFMRSKEMITIKNKFKIKNEKLSFDFKDFICCLFNVDI